MVIYEVSFSYQEPPPPPRYMRPVTIGKTGHLYFELYPFRNPICFLILIP